MTKPAPIVDQFLTGPDVDRRYHRSSQSRWRWGRDPKLNFPKPMKINGKNFYKLSELEAWEQRMAAAS